MQQTANAKCTLIDIKRAQTNRFDRNQNDVGMAVDTQRTSKTGRIPLQHPTLSHIIIST